MIRTRLSKYGILLTLALAGGVCLAAEKGAKKGGTADGDPSCPMCAQTFAGLALRNIGPAMNSGRVSDIAVDPSDPSRWYVAAASGGVWRTDNSGITWKPVFDSAGSYSIGCLAIDPKDPLVIWVGTGENNSQRSVGYGDGIYRSEDGGNTWKNMGLGRSEHIGKIAIDPRDSKTVYVAAQGPLWSPGGERGLYKTTDGGKSWKAVLEISENTGVSDIAVDPVNPDVLYVSAYQRRRHVWTIIDGGPESGIYKSTDAGGSWTKLASGLPEADMGRIGLAVPPARRNTIYAIIEAAEGKGGFFRSRDAGATWEKMSDYCSGAPQYYQEIIPDPLNPDRVYSMDTWMMVTEDGGKSFRKVGEKYKHVDNHALWIDPGNTDHLIAGCDGGIYDSFDRGATWRFFPNLPITQFYRVTPDSALPFYNVYGGTQDNNTMGGPSRTTTDGGIRNSDWFVTVGGDGFKTQVDPLDPDTVYSQYQHAGIVRFDRKSGEAIDIQPQAGRGEEPLRWNWDSPLIISPHSNLRLYFGANRLFRSDDRGDSWKPVSGDLTRKMDRNKLKVMGKLWGPEAVAKSASTSFFGNIVSLCESPLKEGLIYVGTDDGLIQVTSDGGTTWRKMEKFPGVPEMAYVSYIEASPVERDMVFASFDNHKMGDFKPYLLKSSDAGASWTPVSGDLPERGSVYSISADDKKGDLLFAGTEFGLFFTVDGGKHWVQLKGNVPPIPIKDLEIQRREGDLVAATFGRGIVILDDYSPLRDVNPARLSEQAILFPARDAAMFVPSTPLGLKDKAFQGDSFFIAPNPPFGAVFTYYLKEDIKTAKAARREEEKRLVKEGKDIPYPTWEQLRAEDREEEPAVILTVTDEEGRVVRRVTGPASAGFHRVAWDLRYPPAEPASLSPPPADNPFASQPSGPLASPGTYRVTLSRRVNGKVTELCGPVSFQARPLSTAGLQPAERRALLEFERETASLQRAVLGAVELAKELQGRVSLLKKALQDTPAAGAGLTIEALRVESEIRDIQIPLVGDATVAGRNEPTPPSVLDRVQGVVSGHWWATCAPTQTHRHSLQVAAADFAPLLKRLGAVQAELKKLEEQAEAAGAPWTPGRFPVRVEGSGGR